MRCAPRYRRRPGGTLPGCGRVLLLVGLDRDAAVALVGPTPAAQATTAFARSSLVGRSARCTVHHAAWAVMPFMVGRRASGPPPRPFRSWPSFPCRVLERLRPCRRCAGRAPCPHARPTGARPAELREDVVRLRVGDRGDVAHGVHLRVILCGELRADRDPVSARELEPERLDERVPAARRPDERVRREHGSRLERHPRRRDRLHGIPDHHLDGPLRERLLRVGADAALNIENSVGPASTRMTRALSCGTCGSSFANSPR